MAKAKTKSKTAKKTPATATTEAELFATVMEHTKTKTPNAVIARPRAIVDGIDITIPDFLYRVAPGFEPGKRAVAIAGNRPREWAPIKKAGEWEKVKPPKMFVDDPSLPVVVKTRDGALVGDYANMAEFEAKHDLTTYPTRSSLLHDGTTIILVGSKPWAGKVAVAAPKKERVGKSKVQIVADLLLRDTGCTSAEVLQATGWPSVSMPKQAELAGLVLRKDKQAGQAMRYWGTKKQ